MPKATATWEHSDETFDYAFGANAHCNSDQSPAGVAMAPAKQSIRSKSCTSQQDSGMSLDAPLSLTGLVRHSGASTISNPQKIPKPAAFGMASFLVHSRRKVRASSRVVSAAAIKAASILMKFEEALSKSSTSRWRVPTPMPTSPTVVNDISPSTSECEKLKC